MKAGTDVSGNRKRLSGILGRGRRGLIMTTDNGELWIIDSTDDVTSLIGRRVIVDGAAAGFDRLRADWIGAAE